MELLVMLLKNVLKSYLKELMLLILMIPMLNGWNMNLNVNQAM